LQVEPVVRRAVDRLEVTPNPRWGIGQVEGKAFAKSPATRSVLPIIQNGDLLVCAPAVAQAKGDRKRGSHLENRPGYLGLLLRER
jgi:hypothetical protein